MQWGCGAWRDHGTLRHGTACTRKCRYVHTYIYIHIIYITIVMYADTQTHTCVCVWVRGWLVTGCFAYCRVLDLKLRHDLTILWVASFSILAGPWRCYQPSVNTGICALMLRLIPCVGVPGLGITSVIGVCGALSGVLDSVLKPQLWEPKVSKATENPKPSTALSPKHNPINRKP